jgi:hypothetical protein
MMKRTGKVRDRKGGVVGTEKEVREVIKELFLGFCSWRVFYALFFQICFKKIIFAVLLVNHASYTFSILLFHYLSRECYKNKKFLKVSTT